MEYNLKLPAADVEFLLSVLTQQPLPYVRTAPLIQSITSQCQAQQAAPAPAPQE